MNFYGSKMQSILTVSASPTDNGDKSSRRTHVRFYQTAIRLGNVGVNLLGRSDDRCTILAMESIKYSIDSIKSLTEDKHVSLEDEDAIESQYNQAMLAVLTIDDDDDDVAVAENNGCISSHHERVSYTNTNVEGMKSFFVDEYKSSLRNLLHLISNPYSSHYPMKALYINDVSDLLGEDSEEIDFVSAVLLHNLGVSYLYRAINLSATSRYSSKKLLKVGSRLLELSLQLVEDQIRKNVARSENQMATDNEDDEENERSCCDYELQLLSLFSHRCQTLSCLYWVGLRLSEQDGLVVDEQETVVLSLIRDMMDCCTKSIYETFALVQDLFQNPRFVTSTSRFVFSNKNCQNAPAA